MDSEQRHCALHGASRALVLSAALAAFLDTFLEPTLSGGAIDIMFGLLVALVIALPAAVAGAWIGLLAARELDARTLAISAGVLGASLGAMSGVIQLATDMGRLGVVTAVLTGVIAGPIVAWSCACDARTKPHGLPSKGAWPVAIWLGFMAHGALLGLLYFNAAGPVVVYRSRSLFYQMMFHAERIAFLPTYWITKPLGGVAQSGGWIGVLTGAELVVMAAIVGWTSFHWLRGTLGDAVRKLTRGRPWVLAAIAAALFVLGLIAPGGTKY